MVKWTSAKIVSRTKTGGFMVESLGVYSWHGYCNELPVTWYPKGPAREIETREDIVKLGNTRVIMLLFFTRDAKDLADFIDLGGFDRDVMAALANSSEQTPALRDILKARGIKKFDTKFTLVDALFNMGVVETPYS